MKALSTENEELKKKIV